jgi:hypothetical protein
VIATSGRLRAFRREEVDFVQKLANDAAVANELLNVTLNNSLNQATMLISHFSGYMWASGRDE